MYKLKSRKEKQCALSTTNRMESTQFMYSYNRNRNWNKKKPTNFVATFRLQFITNLVVRFYRRVFGLHLMNFDFVIRHATRRNWSENVRLTRMHRLNWFSWNVYRVSPHTRNGKRCVSIYWRHAACSVRRRIQQIALLAVDVVGIRRMRRDDVPQPIPLRPTLTDYTRAPSFGGHFHRHKFHRTCAWRKLGTLHASTGSRECGDAAGDEIEHERMTTKTKRIHNRLRSCTSSGFSCFHEPGIRLRTKALSAKSASRAQQQQ